ncbi:MAG: zinc-ribbon domain-containing protein [Candidatus Methanoplasma sp.]|jgi:ribosomal protein L40E|nr:zinc-ribbon domain-containing protein [Candidatus Methanoplasma sp.]
MATSGIENAAAPKLFGFTQKQIFGIVIAFILAFVLTIGGINTMCCFGSLIIAVVLFMIPRFVGVDKLKFMIPYGVVFMVVTILVGAFVMAPVSIHEAPQADDDRFTNVTYEYNSDGSVHTEAELVDHDPASSHEVYFYYWKVAGIEYIGTMINLSTLEKVKATTTLTIDGSGSKYVAEVDLIPDLSPDSKFNPDTFYSGNWGITKTNDDGEEVDDTPALKYRTDLKGAYTGSITSLSLYGCAYVLFTTMMLFFIIAIFTTWTRKRFEKTREKMEAEGRLYPQGYGRCEKCGNIVLPGEINCRKCGTYIDRPEEIKPNKKDFFECSDCGAEVPNDATVCPRCGAKFDEEDEIEVQHADGTVESTNVTFECSDCGAEVPEAATFCPKCGAKFEK